MKKISRGLSILFTPLLIASNLLVYPLHVKADEKTIDSSVEESSSTEEHLQDSSAEEATETTESSQIDSEESTEESSDNQQSTEDNSSDIETNGTSETVETVPEKTSDVDVVEDSELVEQELDLFMPTEEVVVQSSIIHFEKSETVESFINKISKEAREVGQKYDIYASVMIAQAILESGSGSSSLSQEPNYNLFGIKGTHNGQTVSMATQEDFGNGLLYTTQANFKVYESFEDSMTDYALLLKEGLVSNPLFYEGAWKSTTSSYREATAYLQGRYATDTQYAEKLNGLIATYELTAFDYQLKETDKKQADKFVKVAKSYLGVPYVWGGTTRDGLDCSALVKNSLKEALEKEFPRVTTEQELQGQTVSLTELEVGDLLFWVEHGETYHVAIYVGNQEFLHAPNESEVVKIDKLSAWQPNFAKRIL